MGQEMARRLGVTHPTGLGYGNEDPWNMLRRALRYSEDMAGLIFQFVGALASRPGAMNDFMRSPMSGNPPPGNPFATGAEPSQEAAWGNPWQSQDPHRPTTTEPWGHGAPPSASGFANPFAHPSAESTAASAPRRSIMIEVRSERPTQLRLELSPEAGNRPLVCHPLHATEGDHRLTDIVADPGDEPCWVLTVSNQQPAGLYRGSITDREWGTPYGCISLRVGSSNAENSGFPRAVTADPSSD